MVVMVEEMVVVVVRGGGVDHYHARTLLCSGPCL